MGVLGNGELPGVSFTLLLPRSPQGSSSPGPVVGDSQPPCGEEPSPAGLPHGSLTTQWEAGATAVPISRTESPTPSEVGLELLPIGRGQALAPPLSPHPFRPTLSPAPSCPAPCPSPRPLPLAPPPRAPNPPHKHPERWLGPIAAGHFPACYCI